MTNQNSEPEVLYTLMPVEYYDGVGFSARRISPENVPAIERLQKQEDELNSIWDAINEEGKSLTPSLDKYLDEYALFSQTESADPKLPELKCRWDQNRAQWREVYSKIRSTLSDLEKNPYVSYKYVGEQPAPPVNRGVLYCKDIPIGYVKID